jgi:hypothetical protein
MTLTDIYVESIKESHARIQASIDDETVIDLLTTPMFPLQYDVKDHNNERGDYYEECDVCHRSMFDVQTVHLGDSRPWTWDTIGVCGACRFTEAIRQAAENAQYERWAREEQEWLDNGGQELIDSEPYVWPDERDTYRSNPDGTVTLITESGQEHTYDPDQLDQ